MQNVAPIMAPVVGDLFAMFLTSLPDLDESETLWMIV